MPQLLQKREAMRKQDMQLKVQTEPPPEHGNGRRNGKSGTETDTSAGTTGLSSGWDETLQNMLMPMDALMMTAVEAGAGVTIRPSPEFFWGALYRELGNHYADASSLITTERKLASYRFPDRYRPGIRHRALCRLLRPARASGIPFFHHPLR